MSSDRIAGGAEGALVPRKLAAAIAALLYREEEEAAAAGVHGDDTAELAAAIAAVLARRKRKTVPSSTFHVPGATEERRNPAPGTRHMAIRSDS
jgi:hypothetical protein